MDVTTETTKQKFMRKLRGNPEKWRSYCEKERLRQKLRREKLKEMMKNDEKSLKQNEIKKKLQKRESKAQQKMQTVNVDVELETDSMGGYASKEEMQKDLEKVKKSLPKNPKLRRAVLMALARMIIPTEMKSNPDKKKKLSVNNSHRSNKQWKKENVQVETVPIKIEYVCPGCDESDCEECYRF